MPGVQLPVESGMVLRFGMVLYMLGFVFGQRGQGWLMCATEEPSGQEMLNPGRKAAAVNARAGRRFEFFIARETFY
jgi:hypothetical protein